MPADPWGDRCSVHTVALEMRFLAETRTPCGETSEPHQAGVSPFSRESPASFLGSLHHITELVAATTGSAYPGPVPRDVSELCRNLPSKFSDHVGQSNHAYGVAAALGGAEDH